MKIWMTLGAVAFSLTALAEKNYQYKDISPQVARPFTEKERHPGGEVEKDKEEKAPPKRIRPPKTIEEKIEDAKKNR